MYFLDFFTCHWSWKGRGEVPGKSFHPSQIPTPSIFQTMATLVLLRAASRRMTPPSLVTMRALFSTRASDNFLSGASSLYAESMAEMYENDPTSVPEVSRSRLRCILPSSSSSLYLLGRYGNSYSLYFSLTTPLCCQICQIY